MVLSDKLYICAGRTIKQADENTAAVLFRPIADLLLNKSILVAGGKEYRIAEIEFYLRTEKHNDETTHNNDRQKKFGEWYIHRKGRSESSQYCFYYSGGIDICLGCGNIPFGVLMRSAVCISDNVKIKSGPIRMLRVLLHDIFGDGFPNAPVLKDKERFQECCGIIEFTGAFQKNKHLYLKPADLEKKEIIWCPRTFGTEKNLTGWKAKKYKARIFQTTSIGLHS
ncbi:MAG: hypothetical protein LBL21_01230 [Rickettsiales bacterium]|jgi:hypothetical protein|nr:hypothetical protein [Rickettsiales bacterium]